MPTPLLHPANRHCLTTCFTTIFYLHSLQLSPFELSRHPYQPNKKFNIFFIYSLPEGTIPRVQPPYHRQRDRKAGTGVPPNPRAETASKEILSESFADRRKRFCSSSFQVVSREVEKVHQVVYFSEIDQWLVLPVCVLLSSLV